MLVLMATLEWWCILNVPLTTRHVQYMAYFYQLYDSMDYHLIYGVIRVEKTFLLSST